MYLLAGIAGIILTVLFFVCVGNSCNIVLVVDKKSKYIIYANYTDANSFNELVKELEKNTEGLKKFSNSKKFNKYYAQQLAELGVDANSIVFENAMFKDYQVVVAKYAETSSIPSYITIDSLEQYKRKYNEATEKIKSLESELTKNNGKTQVLPKSNDEALKSKYESLLNEVKTKNKDLEEQLKKATSGKVDESVKEQLAAAEKLKKKIKDLEDDLEEARDNAEKFEKKLKNEEKEVHKLEDDVAKLNKEKTQLESDWKDAVEQLHDTEKELDLKMQSLLFVQEILSAKETNDESTKHLHGKVNAIRDFVKGDLHDTLTTTYNLNKDTAEYLYDSGLEKWVVTSKKSWIKGKTAVAFVGEFSAGKTSIVNRILSHDNPNIPLLPVSTKATTAIPTYISGGIKTEYQFVSKDNLLKRIEESTFKRVNKEVLDQVKGASSLIKYFVMTYRNPNLDNISILDTPGFSSNDKDDAERTVKVINECDALFWVFDVNAGTINRSTINLIKEELHKPLFIVINKIDTKANSEVDKVEQLIKKTLQEAGISISGVIRFSKNASIDELMKVIASVKRDTSDADYLDSVRNFMKKCCNEYEKLTTKAQQKVNELTSKSDGLVGQYNRAIQYMQSDCNSAAGIPRSGFFVDYKMTSSEFNRLVSLLNAISSSRCDALCDLYNKQMDVRQELQNAWNNHSEVRNKWKILDSSLDQFNRLVNNLKQ